MHPNDALLERITTDSNILGGKPIVRGTRVSVEIVLEHLAEELDFAVLAEIFPHLTLDDVKACLLFGASASAASHDLPTMSAPALFAASS